MRRELETALKNELGLPDYQLEYLHRPFSESTVWRVLTPDRETVAWVKDCQSTGKRARALRAMGEWLPAIGLPSPIIACLGACTLLLDHIQGEPLSTLSPKSDESRALYLRAGEILRRLHQLPSVDEDPLPLPMAIRQREKTLLTWLGGAKAESSIRLALKREVSALFSLAESIHQRPLPAKLSRVPTHRDLRPEHILWSRSTDQLTLIDFSQSRLDWCAADLVKLYEPDEPIEAQSRASFFDGYQPPLDMESDRGAEIMNASLLLRARFFFQLASLRWSLRTGERQRIWAIRSAIDTIIETLQNGKKM